VRVKRYVVDALSDAVPLIRSELGKDAVILESKEIKTGGFLGMFRKRKLEVLAAVEPNAAKQDLKGTKKLADDQVDLVIEQILKASQRSKVQHENKEAAEQQPNARSQSEDKIASANGTAPINNFASRVYGGAAGSPKAEKTVEQLEPAEKMPVSAKESTPTTVVNKVKTPEAQASLSATEQFIVNELQSLKNEMIKISKNSISNFIPSEQLQALKSRLLEQEVEAQWIEILYDEFCLREQQGEEPLSANELWQHAKVRFYEWLAPYDHGKLSAATRFVQFVGPTGVGKTTTIAKLAANYSIKEQKKLGLITADTYRIAAVEQLRTYANILNIPLEVVFSPLELERALTALEQAQLVLMDTAGRNFKSDLHVSEVNSLLPSNEQSESVLVMSLTSRTSDMKIIAEKFSKYGVRKVVFTKIDESSSYGIIFNMIMLYGLTPLFLTSGQNVPDDIEAFNLEKYIDMLLGEPHHV